MANPPKRKGTAFEREVLEDLRSIFGPGVFRSPPSMPWRDFVGCPIRVECKHRYRWEIVEWSRRLHYRTTEEVVRVLDDMAEISREALREIPRPWVLFVAWGDRREAMAPPDVVVMPRRFAVDVLRAWWAQQRDRKPDGASAVSSYEDMLSRFVGSYGRITIEEMTGDADATTDRP